MLERILFCFRGQHRETSFVSYCLPGGILRVKRCLHCNELLDVNYRADSSQVSLEVKLEPNKLGDGFFETIPGYPKQERFR